MSSIVVVHVGSYLHLDINPRTNTNIHISISTRVDVKISLKGEGGIRDQKILCIM